MLRSSSFCVAALLGLPPVTPRVVDHDAASGRGSAGHWIFLWLAGSVLRPVRVSSFAVHAGTESVSTATRSTTFMASAGEISSLATIELIARPRTWPNRR